MWSNWKMKFMTFNHNDDVKCFHVVVQGTHKLVVMGRTNFKDDVFIKRQWENEKMNVIGEMFKDMKKQGNRQKQFAFVVRNCAHFLSFGIYNSMSEQSAIEKL